MKKLLLFSLISAFSTAAIAQPTLTAATNNPVIGDDFGIYYCITTGLTPGSSGTAVTWDYHSLIKADSGMVSIVSCASTLVCDSFPGAALALRFTSPGPDTEYTYFTVNTDVFWIIGDYTSSPMNLVHYLTPDIILKYPATYASSYLDTSINYNYYSPPLAYPINMSSRTIDAYGTLVLPSGTYNNVLRVHQTTVEIDSIPGDGNYYSGYYESYRWFTADFHMFLMAMDFDSSSGPGLSVSNVVYLTNPSAGVGDVKNTDRSFSLSPNPASDVLNITLAIDKVQNASLTFSDISGKVVDKVDACDLRQGENKIQYSVANLPSGLYLLHYTDDTHSVTKKVVVSH